MTLFTAQEILVEHLRTELTDPRGRHTNTTLTGTASAGTEIDLTTLTTYNLTVQCIRELRIDAVAKQKWRDYYIDLPSQKLIMTSALSGGEAVAVDVKEGSTSWIYDDLPLAGLSATSYPRIGITVQGSPGERLGRYDADVEHNNELNIEAFAKEKQTFTLSDGRVYEGQSLSFALAIQCLQVLKNTEDTLYPILYDYSPVGGARNLPFDTNRQAHHATALITLKQINIGEEL